MYLIGLPKLLYGPLKKVIHCNYHVEIYLKAWFCLSLYIFGMVCFGNTDRAADSSALVLFLGGRQRDGDPMNGSSLYQEPRNEKMRQKRRGEQSCQHCLLGGGSR